MYVFLWRLSLTLWNMLLHRIKRGMSRMWKIINSGRILLYKVSLFIIMMATSALHFCGILTLAAFLWYFNINPWRPYMHILLYACFLWVFKVWKQDIYAVRHGTILVWVIMLNVSNEHLWSFDALIIFKYNAVLRHQPVTHIHVIQRQFGVESCTCF